MKIFTPRHSFIKLFSVFCLLNFLFQNNSANAAVKTWTAAGGGAWNVGANWSGATVPVANDDIVFTNAGAITVTAAPVITINSFSKSGAGVLTLQGGGVITINNSVAVNDLTVTAGGLIISTGCSITMAGGSATNVSVGATLTIALGRTFTITSLAATTATINGTISTAGIITLGAASVMTVNGSMNNTNTASTFTSTVTSLIFSAGSSYNHQTTGGVVPIAGWNATSTCTISGLIASNITSGLSQTFGHFTWNCAGQTTATGAINGNMTINGDFFINAGTMSDAGFIITGNAAKIFVLGPGTFFTDTRTTTPWLPTNYTMANFNVDPSSRINFNGLGSFIIPSTQVTTYGELGIGGSGTKTLSANILVGGITINAGTFADGGFSISTFFGSQTLTIASGASFQIGTATVASTFPTSFLTYAINAASTVIYNSNVAQLISNIPPYGNLTLASSAAVTKTPDGGALSVSGTLTINLNNTLDLAGFDILLGGGYVNNGTLTANAPGSIVDFVGTVAQTFTTSTGTYTGNLISNLIVTNSSASGVTLGAQSATLGFTNVSIGNIFNLGGQTIKIAGTYLNSGTLTGNAAGSTINFNGASGQTFTVGTYTASTLGGLTINNAAGVTLGSPVNVTTLTLTAGPLTTTAANLITVTGTTAANVPAPGLTSWVNGPFARTLPASLASGSTYIFPVGKSAYKLFQLVNPTTSIGGTVVIKAEVFDANAGGTSGPGVGALNTNRYWNATVTSGAVNLTSTGKIGLYETTPVMVSGTDHVCNSSTQSGVYTISASTVTASIATTNNAGPIALGFFVIGKGGNLTGTYTIGTTGQFLSLTNSGGFFETMNAGTVTGNITASIVTDLLIETGLNALNQWVENPAASNFTLTMQSSAAVQRLISASYNGGGVSTNGLIRFDGADRVTVNGGTVAQRFLLFRNTNTTAGGQNATFQLLNDATSNYFNNCIIEGSSPSNSNGVFVFGTTTGTTGNDNNTVTLCDIHDCTSPVNTPDNGIFASGNNTAGKENSGIIISNCNISNFWHATSDCNGILINTGNTTWSMTGNSFFQTSSRVMASEMNGIQIANSSGNGFTVTGNYVGGQAANAGGGALTLTGNAVFRGLRFSLGSATATSVQGNFIQNLSITTSNASTAQCGISLTAGSFNCGDVTSNNIGSQSATGNILFSCSAASSVFSGIIAGTGTPGTIVISNNTIGGISVSGIGTISLRGINTQGTATSYTISGNTIGSTTIANSLSNSTNSTLFGILSSATTTVPTTTVNTITGNTIVNLASTGGANAAAQLVGISVTGGVNTVTLNTIRLLSSTNPNVGSNGNSSVIGLLETSTIGAVALPQIQTISQNTIHTLSNSAAGAVGVIGICVSPFSATGASLLAKNFIHSFSTSSTTAFQQGINSSTGGTATGVVTIQNNMIRLGIDAAGASITTSASIIGINKNIAANSNIIFNSVYIGGTAVASGAINTAAFQRLQSGTDEIRDNIFVNARSNTSGTGVHYAYSLNAITTVTSDYNIYYSPGTGGAVSSVGAVAFSLQGLRFTVTGQDLHSGLGDPNFITPLGASATVNLHLNNATPAEGTGITTTATVTDDFDGTTRSTVTPIDIGADAGNFNALVAATDVFTPMISYNAITNLSACGTTVTFTATVTDVGAGIPTSGLNVPQVWYRRSLPSATAWTNSPGTLVSGTAFNSVWSFTITITPILGETYQYYLVAQDLATNPVNPNIWFSKFDATTPSFTNNNVNTPITHPTTPDSYTIVNSLGGTVYVGTGAGTPVYNTFNGAAGLFAAINSGVLSSDLTVIVQNSVTEVTTTPLNQFSSTCGGPYKITIQPDGTTLRIISGNLTTALIQINGADSVTVDGNFSGAGRYLRFQNQNGGTGVNLAPTFYLTNDSRRITVKNCEVEGFTSNQSSGVVFIGAGTTTGNDYFTLDNCSVHEKTNVFGGYPIQLIYSNGLAGAPNDNVTLTNNNIYNWSSFGGGSGARNAVAINVTATGNGSNWTITGNSLYNTFVDGSGYQDGITFIPGSSSNNNVISNNYIGGNNPLCVGTGGTPYWANSYNDGSSTNNELDIITLNCGTVTLSGNTIKRIRNTNSDNSGVVVFDISGSTTPTISSNIIGDAGGASVDQVVATGGGLSLSIYPGYIYGIYSSTSGTVTVNQNNFYYLAQLGAYTGGGSYTVYHIGSGAITVTNNNIIGSQAAGIGYDSYAIEIKPSSTISGVQIDNNIIDGPYILDNGGSFVTTTAIFVNGTNLSGTINNNRIYDMRNNCPDGQVEGIWLNGTGNWNLKNNQVSLGNYSSVTPTNRLGIFGIEDDLSNAVASSVTAYYNTVLIGGTQATGTNTFNNSMAFVRFPGQLGNVTGDITTLANNIFINNRTGGTTAKHYAIVNYGTSNFATNWNAGASNYNFISSNNAATLGIWGTTDETFTNWKTASNGDGSSWNVNAVTAGASTVTQLNPTDLFTAPITGNLNINPANQACWFVNGKGIAGASSGSINSDYGGGTRGTTFGYATDIGANEFNANVGVYPFALSAIPVLSGTNVFTFAGRTVGSITWGAVGTVPASVSFEYYSGDVPGTNPSPVFPGSYNNTDFTFHITASGGSGYTYNASLYYDDADKGDFAVVAEGTMMLIKTNPSNNWITRSTTINTVLNIITSNGLTDFSFFTGSDGSILPIQLTSFTVSNYHAIDALLNWSTSSELNNDHFECEVATVTDNNANLVFRKLGEVKGNGTSLIAHNYSFIDTEIEKSGIRYYRVKQVDFDGMYTYTNIKSLLFEINHLMSAEIFPNPTMDVINIPINNELNNLTMNILSIDGRVMNCQTISSDANATMIDVSAVPAGVYLVRIINENNSVVETKRFIKLQ